jgi:hypothetical protein
VTYQFTRAVRLLADRRLKRSVVATIDHRWEKIGSRAARRQTFLRPMGAAPVSVASTAAHFVTTLAEAESVRADARGAFQEEDWKTPIIRSGELWTEREAEERYPQAGEQLTRVEVGHKSVLAVY